MYVPVNSHSQNYILTKFLFRKSSSIPERLRLSVENRDIEWHQPRIMAVSKILSVPPLLKFRLHHELPNKRGKDCKNSMGGSREGHATPFEAFEYNQYALFSYNRRRNVVDLLLKYQAALDLL